MDEPNPDETPRITGGGSLAEGPPRRPDSLLRRILIPVGLAAVGLIATPVGIFLSGLTLSGSTLFSGRNIQDGAQGFYSGLTIIGLLVAPVGALYWFVAGAWLGGRVGPAAENRVARWGAVITVYVVILVVIAALTALAQR